MASYQTASESAIKHAQELMKENKVYEALHTLNEFVVGKKKFAAQPSALEKVMVEYIDIAVKRSELYLLKETLVHFRNICQHSHDDNIRAAISHYRKRLSHDFTALLNKADPEAPTPEAKLKQLVPLFLVVPSNKKLRTIGKHSRLGR